MFEQKGESVIWVLKGKSVNLKISATTFSSISNGYLLKLQMSMD